MNEHYPFVNTPLPYAYDALEPYIDTKTMHLHHDKHLQTYIDNLNDILKKHPELQWMSLEQLIINAQTFPKSVQTPIKNNAGGVYNHQFYFSNLKNPSTKEPDAPLNDYIFWNFGSFELFKKLFKAAALSVFGSGYAWLVADQHCIMKIITTANQDTPLPQGLYSLLNLDVWEHAYYLKHYNVRAAYIDDWFQIVNWDNINQNLIGTFSL